MKNHPLAYMIILAVAFMFGLVPGQSRPVLAQEPGETVFITVPQEGQTISGLVTVTGAIAFPNFLKYEIFLKTGRNLIWGATVYAPVINGTLARIDTRTFADGTYQLIIRKVEQNSNYTDVVGPSVTIQNNLGAPLPYPEVEASPLYPPPSGALLRVKNCAGEALDFDYISDDQFSSSGDFLLKGKPEGSPVCSYEDILIGPGEYRGTARGEGIPGVSYSFIAESGKIYEATYNGPGAGQFHFFVVEVAGDARASTDTGGTIELGAAAAPVSAAAAPGSMPVAGVPAPQNQSMLPVSGQEPVSRTPVIVGGIGFILFLIIGGVLAVRRRGLAPGGEKLGF